MAKKPYISPRKDRDLVWVGSSLDDLSRFDPELKHAFGYQLRQVQWGDTPENARSSEIPGTMKLVEDDNGETYRVVYTTKLKTAVYILHAFQKKSKKGIATPNKDLDLIRNRMKRAGEIDKNREEDMRREEE